MNEVEMTMWMGSAFAFVIGVGGPIWGIAIARGKQQAFANSQAKIVDDKLNTLIRADTITQELIRNNTSVMEKIDTTLNIFLQVTAAR